MKNQKEIAQQIQTLGPWFQNMNLQGVDTAPNHFLGDYPKIKWDQFSNRLPTDLSGKSVLDIGCNAGFYSMEMKRRGASRVLGIDFDDDYLAQARYAASINQLDIEFRTLSVYDLMQLKEQFDIVLFMGVFYHLRHPLLALDLIRQCSGCELMIFQSMLRGSKAILNLAPDYSFEEDDHFDQPSSPKLFFVEHEYSHDPTNWWIPNKAGIEAILRSSGFRILSNPEEEVYFCAPDEPGHALPSSMQNSSRGCHD